IEPGGDGTRIALSGRVGIDTVDALRAELTSVPAEGPVLVDVSTVEALDTAGAWLIATLGPEARVTLEGARPEQVELLDTVRKALATAAEPGPKGPTGLVGWLDGVGRATGDVALAALRALSFFGLTLVRIA